MTNALRKIYRRTPEFEAIQRTDNPKLSFPYEYQVVDVTWSVLEMCGDNIVDLLYDPINHPDDTLYRCEGTWLRNIINANSPAAAKIAGLRQNECHRRHVVEQWTVNSAF